MITQQIDLVRGDILAVKFKMPHVTADSKFTFECRPKFQKEVLLLECELVNNELVVTFLPEFSLNQKWSIGEYRIIHAFNGVRDVIASGNINIVLDASHSPNYHTNTVSIPSTPVELIPVSITSNSKDIEVPDLEAIFILNLN